MCMCALRLGICRGRHVNAEANQRVFHQRHVMPRQHGGDVGRRLAREDEDLGLGKRRAARSVLQRPAQIGHRCAVASGRGGAIDAAAKAHACAGVLWRQGECTPALVGGGGACRLRLRRFACDSRHCQERGRPLNSQRSRTSAGHGGEWRRSNTMRSGGAPTASPGASAWLDGDLQTLRRGEITNVYPAHWRKRRTPVAGQPREGGAVTSWRRSRGSLSS